MNLKGFTVFELILMALLASIGIAAKPVVVPLAHMITVPLGIPGGAIAGGLYMFWIVLARGLVKKNGAATITAFTQAIIVMVTGFMGSHGLLSIVTYTLPGIVVDLYLLIFRRPLKTSLDFFVAGILANMAGAYMTIIVFFRLPLIPMLTSLSGAVISGGLGGIIAYRLYLSIIKTGVVTSDEV
jgi:energy-coupling factor transport system substrate-specific component